jgi:L-lactate permease
MLGFSALDAAALAATGELDVTVAVTGVQATGAVGTVVVVAKAVTPVTVVEATGQTGTVVVIAKADVPRHRVERDCSKPHYESILR